MSYQEARSAGRSYDSNAFEYDVAIVGGGSAGYAAARTSAAAGQRTVVIDDGVDDGSRTRQLATDLKDGDVKTMNGEKVKIDVESDKIEVDGFAIDVF